MKTKEVIESNKMVAVFMGAIINNVGKGDFLKGQEFFNTIPSWCGDLEYHGLNADYIVSEHIKYNSSWDWLMPVIEKIESLGFKWGTDEIKYSCFRIENIFCSITSHTGTRQSLCLYQTPYGSEPVSKLQAVYDGVIAFIKIYNALIKTK